MDKIKELLKNKKILIGIIAAIIIVLIVVIALVFINSTKTQKSSKASNSSELESEELINIDEETIKTYKEKDEQILDKAHELVMMDDQMEYDLKDQEEATDKEEKTEEEKQIEEEMKMEMLNNTAQERQKIVNEILELLK